MWVCGKGNSIVTDRKFRSEDLKLWIGLQILPIIEDKILVLRCACALLPVCAPPTVIMSRQGYN